MKTRLSSLLAGAMLLCFGLGTAQAQQHPTHQQVGTVHPLVNDADSAEVYRVLSEIAPHAFNIPGAPRFVVVGKDQKFYLGIGGTIKGVIGYDFPNPVDNSYAFATSAIPMHNARGNNGKVLLSANQSSLFLTLAALPGTKNQLGVYINVNLCNPNYTPNLAYAYMTWRGIKAGYDYSLFSDMAAGVPTIDYEGPNSWIAIPNVVLDYEHAFNKHWKVAAGLERPQNSFTTGQRSYSVSQRVPDIPAYVQYSWDEGSSWFRLAGIVRNLFYRDDLQNKTRDIVGWGISASGSAKITSNLVAYYQAAYGKGMTSYFQDLNGAGLDLVPKQDNPGQLEAVEAWGAYLGLQYNWSPKVFTDIAYSHLRNYAPHYTSGETPFGDQYKYGQYAVANVFWQITPMVQTGLEYIWGRKVDHNGLSRHDNRLQAAIQVSF